MVKRVCVSPSPTRQPRHASSESCEMHVDCRSSRKQLSMSPPSPDHRKPKWANPADASCAVTTSENAQALAYHFTRPHYANEIGGKIDEGAYMPTLTRTRIDRCSNHTQTNIKTTALLVEWCLHSFLDSFGSSGRGYHQYTSSVAQGGSRSVALSKARLCKGGSSWA